MNASDWTQAVQGFNEKRQEKSPSETLVPIQGRVFQEELLKVEKAISQHLQANDFRSSTSGTETFWRRHCYAVPGFGPNIPTGATTANAAGLFGGPAPSGSLKGKGKATLKKGGLERKEQVCQRCHCRKYPGGARNKEINHKRSECNDGVSSSLKNIPYPFASGVIRGKELSIDTLRQKYNAIQSKQLEKQPLLIEEENLLEFYSQNVCKGPNNTMYLAFGDLVIPPTAIIDYINQKPHIKL